MLPRRTTTTLVGLWLATCPLACGEPPSASPAGSTASPAAPPSIPTLRRAHGFVIPWSFAHVCSQHTTMSPSGHLRWDLYATPDEPRAVWAFYRDAMGDVVAQDDGDGWVWRIPSAERPAHVMTVYPRARTGMPTCGRDPPSDARTLANLSTLVR